MLDKIDIMEAKELARKMAVSGDKLIQEDEVGARGLGEALHALSMAAKVFAEEVEEESGDA